MAEYFAWKDSSELFLRTGDVSVGPIQFRCDSYYSGHPLFGVPVPGKISGSIIEATEDQIANAKSTISRSWIVPHHQLSNAYKIIEIIELEGPCPGGVPLGTILALLPLDYAVSKGYHSIASPGPSVSDRVSQPVTA